MTNREAFDRFLHRKLDVYSAMDKKNFLRWVLTQKSYYANLVQHYASLYNIDVYDVEFFSQWLDRLNEQGLTNREACDKYWHEKINYYSSLDKENFSTLIRLRRSYYGKELYLYTAYHNIDYDDCWSWEAWLDEESGEGDD